VESASGISATDEPVSDEIRVRVGLDFQFSGGPTEDDVFFQIVRLPEPEAFSLSNVEMTYTVGESVRVGFGSVTAGLGSISATMEDRIDPETGLISSGSGTPGKILKPEQYGTLTGTTTDGSWIATGAYVNRRRFLTDVAFRLSSVEVRTESNEDVAFTRELYYGVRPECLKEFTSLPGGRHKRDRLDDHAFGRRIAVRSLWEDDNSNCPTAVIYNGAPADQRHEHAIWLALCVLTGSTLQPAVTETYSESGALLMRRFRPGIEPGPRGSAPFHSLYAPYVDGTFGRLCEQILALLNRDFPIDVVIAHLHDANDGTMERRMQSCLLGIYAASEAWNRSRDEKTHIKPDIWEVAKGEIVASATSVARVYSEDLSESVRQKVLGANHVGTNAKLRAFFTQVSIGYVGATKEAVDLRNRLFHNGYLRRRSAAVGHNDLQQDYDYMKLLIEVTMRIIFSLCDIEVPLHSVVSPMNTISVRDTPSAKRNRGDITAT